MVLGYHIIYSMYGFWLPIDPRGSWSEFVASWELFRYGGPATKVSDRRSHAWDEHDARKRLEMKQKLKYPPVVLTGEQARSVAHGFARVAAHSGYEIHALSILPGHGHMVLGRHHYDVEQVVRRLKQAAGSHGAAHSLHRSVPVAGSASSTTTDMRGPQFGTCSATLARKGYPSSTGRSWFHGARDAFGHVVFQTTAKPSESTDPARTSGAWYSKYRH